MFGVGPDTLDWSAGLDSMLSFLSSIPVLLVVFGAIFVLVRRLGSSPPHIASMRSESSLPGGA